IQEQGDGGDAPAPQLAVRDHDRRPCGRRPQRLPHVESHHLRQLELHASKDSFFPFIVYPGNMAGDFLSFPKPPCRGSAAADVWVAPEKIHGAHLVIDVDADTVRFGKRKGWLTEDEPFFGWQLLRGALRETARKAFDRIDADRMILYGELFGG